MADYIPLFLDWACSTEGLSDAEKGRLVDAMVAYAIGEDTQNFIKGNERFVFNVMRGQIDRHFEYLQAQKDKGKLGGRPQKPKETQGFQPETQGFEGKPNNSNSNSNSNSEDIGELRSPTRARARFTPPSVDEVDAYARSIGKPIDAEYFVNFYTSKGWVVGKSPMKDWRAAVRNWAKSGDAKHPARRDYSGDELPW